MNNALDRLIRPQSIAVFGGSWAHSVIEQCVKMGYTGKLWPVHPTHKSVAGFDCYASIDALPSPPDVSFLGVNRNVTIELVEQLASIGAGGAVCFAAGFSEAIEEDAYAEQLQEALLHAAGDMPILGPNCYGFINCLDRALLWPDQHGGVPVSKGVAIVTQSSNIAINLTMQTRGLPIAYVFTAGNQASITLAQLALTALEDERVTAVGLHIEGFASIRDFEQLAARARVLGKSMVALKVGKSDAAQLALKSHTSSLAGSDASANAFLSRLGIARVHSLTVFLETLKLFHLGGALNNNCVLSMSCSGGEACLMGDAATEHGLHCPALNDSQHAALRAALGSRVALANPLDYHTYIWNDWQAMHDMFAGMLKSEAGIAVLVLDFPRPDRCEFDSWLVAIDAFKKAGCDWPGRLAVLASLPENMPESIAAELLEAGVVPLCGLDDAMAAIAAASMFSATAHDTPALSSSPGSNRQTAPVLLAAKKSGSMPTTIRAIEEAEAKRWLSSCQIQTPNGVVLNATTLNRTDSSADKLNLEYLKSQVENLQWPLVLKSTGSLHKSELGGVVLNILNEEQLQEAIIGMGFSGDFSGDFLVEEQIDYAVELLVGIVRDPVHGFLLTVGAGGVQTELLSDTVSALLPVEREDLPKLLRQLRCFELLTGYRGSAGCDMDSLLNTIMYIQQAVIGIADDLYELEINPLLCTENGTIAADALLRIDARSNLGRH